MYQVGKNKFQSVEAYRKLLVYVLMAFVLLLIILIYLKPNMPKLVFNLTALVDVLMLIHIPLKYLHSKNLIKYPLNKY